MTTLVAIGCSHTHGSALDGYGGIAMSGYNKEHCFAGLLNKKYNFTNYYNLGLPGGSNQYIMRSISKFILEHMDPDEDYIFLIGWTSTERIELRYPDSTNHEHSVETDLFDRKYIPFTLGTDLNLFHSGEVRRLMGYSPLIFDEELLSNDWAAYAYSAQQMFKNNNIKYYMFNTCFELPVTEWNKPIIDALDTTHYYNPIDFDSSMLYWGLTRGFEKTDCWHLKQDGHQAWCEFLEERLKELKYL
jgi:hypothetical protein